MLRRAGKSFPGGVGLCVAAAPPRTASLGRKQVLGSVGFSVGMKRLGWPSGAAYVVPCRVCEHGSPPCPTSQGLLTPPGDRVWCVQANSGPTREASSLSPGLAVGSAMALWLIFVSRGRF